MCFSQFDQNEIVTTFDNLITSSLPSFNMTAPSYSLEKADEILQRIVEYLPCDKIIISPCFMWWSYSAVLGVL